VHEYFKGLESEIAALRDRLE
jgi:hypothetical protein